MKLVNWRPFAICAVLGAVIFCLCFHLEVLNPLNVRWLLQADWGQSFVGWQAYRNDAWRLPLGAEALLDWPSGDNIIFTDSLPTLAVPFKLLAPILPEPFQYVGWWFFSSLVLQVYFGYRLSRKAGLDELEALIGGFLIGLTPFYLARLYHNTLFSHWMILLALEIFGFQTKARRRNVGFAVLLVLSALTNFYLTFMVAGIFAADVLRTLFRREHPAPAVGGAAALTLAPLVVAMLLMGFVTPRQSSAGGFGFYLSEALAWINPQDPLNSRFLPPIPVSEGAYEGFQYLGLGMILLVLLGLGLRLQRALHNAPAPVDAAPTEGARFDGAEFLAPVLVVFWVFALSDRVHVGKDLVIDLHYGSVLGPITSMLRSSGRFMWPVSYAVILAALLAIARQPRRWIKAVLVAGLILQLADLSAFMRQQWKYTDAAANPAALHRLKSPQWDRMISAARAVDVQPSDPRAQLELFWELAFHTTRLRVPLTTMYSARVDPAQLAFQKADEADIRQGRFASDRLYVFADGCVPATGPQVYRLDDVIVLPPKNADLSGLSPAPRESIQCRPVKIKSASEASDHSR